MKEFELKKSNGVYDGKYDNLLFYFSHVYDLIQTTYNRENKSFNKQNKKNYIQEMDLKEKKTEEKELKEINNKEEKKEEEKISKQEI